MEPLEIFRACLAADADRARESVPVLQARLRALRAQYGGRDLVRVLRPKLLTEGEYVGLEYDVSVLAGAARRLAERVLAEPALQEFVELTEGERRLLAPEPLVPDPAPLTRWDSFLTPDGPRFVELNAEAPAGCGYGDVIAEAFLEHPTIQEFVRRTGARPIPTREAVLLDLLTAWRAAGRTSRPRILITDYLDVSTTNEFLILRDHFRRRGFEATVEDPRRLEYRDGKLYAHGQAWDLVYRRVLVNEFLEREAEVRALFAAYRDRAVVMVNPFRCKVLHKKTIFALLTGDGPGGVEALFTAEERRVIAARVPWTRKVRETKTSYEGRVVDLVPFLRENRARMAIKPADDYGGRGVVLGWTCDAEAFDAALTAALRGGYVAQERVPAASELFPHFDRALEEVPLVVDLDPYVGFGRVRGVLARLAAGQISNVTSGGGQTPVFVVPT
jgi:hypothetical protein